MTKFANTKTLIDLLENGDPNHPAIVVPDGPVITYGSLRDQVRAMASELKNIGVNQYDRIAIVLSNTPETIISFLAAASAATAAPLNPAYKKEEFQFYLDDTKAKAIITNEETGEAAVAAAAGTTITINIQLNPDGLVKLDPSTSEVSTNTTESTPRNSDDVALILHTSGTTSRPKRVPLSHEKLVASVEHIVDTYKLSKDDVSLCVMPLFHVHGLVASTLSTLASGGTIIVPPRFNALNFWRLVREYGVTWFTAVPTMHQALLARARTSQANTPGGEGHSTLRFIRSCSAPLAAATMLEMEDKFGVPVLEAYGMTEASHQMSSNPLPPEKRIPGSVGRGTGVSISIMNDAGVIQPADTRGEVVIKGPNVIAAYEDNPEANVDSFTNGWFRTGDEGSIDNDGYLTLLGRIKEIINRSGEKISPQEIDEVLLSHPAVSEAVAFAAPHSTHGEEPTAAVVLHTAIAESELVKHCREHLADFKCPRTIHIVDQIPRTATGKVQRRMVAAVIIGSEPR